MTVIKYYRPATLAEALARLNPKDTVCIPLGGGSGINRSDETPIEVVDLQLLGLSGIDQEGARIRVGATTPLQALVDSPLTPPALRQAIELEASHNQRQMATLAGKLVTADGRSPLATVLLAMDAELTWAPGDIKTKLGDWLPLREAIAAGARKKPGLVITSITWSARVSTAFQYIARTPTDRPIVCIGLGGWRAGAGSSSASIKRTRVAVGGFGLAPRLGMDGPEPEGAEVAVKDVCDQAGDEWASADYRSEMAVVLTRRCLQELEEN